jgi:pimeloyl-ACP methyl ester carboxylesterase
MSADATVEIRVHGRPGGPVVIYLPGLHGNWTLIGAFRKEIAPHARFVELAYPPTLAWSLDEYAAAVERVLAEHGIAGGWLLAESFGSQVAWRLLHRRRFNALGLILAGGFVRHPARWGARMAERIVGGASLAAVVRVLFGYARVSRLRFRRSPETVAGIEEFVRGFTEEHRRAATHRLRLVAENDPRRFAREVEVPVYALAGAIDPIVPWPWVKRWLKKNCPAFRESRLLWPADHNVLGTAPERSARQIMRWLNAGANGSRGAAAVTARTR